jgi:hypothetical protein
MGDEVLAQTVQCCEMRRRSEPSEREGELEFPDSKRTLISYSSNQDRESSNQLLITQCEDKAFEDFFASFSGKLSARFGLLPYTEDAYDSLVQRSHACHGLHRWERRVEAGDYHLIRLVQIPLGKRVG